MTGSARTESHREGRYADKELWKSAPGLLESAAKYELGHSKKPHEARKEGPGSYKHWVTIFHWSLIFLDTLQPVALTKFWAFFFPPRLFV